jgi:hypothetical protein
VSSIVVLTVIYHRWIQANQTVVKLTENLNKKASIDLIATDLFSNVYTCVWKVFTNIFFVNSIPWPTENISTSFSRHLDTNTKRKAKTHRVTLTNVVCNANLIQLFQILQILPQVFNSYPSNKTEDLETVESTVKRNFLQWFPKNLEKLDVQSRGTLSINTTKFRLPYTEVGL